MPQARLPDINTAFTKHRNEVITSLKAMNYDSVFGSLYALNALLPDTLTDEENPKPKYRVIISDIEYAKLTKPTTNVWCYHCKSQFVYEQLKFYQLLLPFIDQCITGSKTTTAWNCLSCHKICKLRHTKMAETQLKEPFYLGVVPKPPRMLEGLGHRSKFHAKMKQWALTFLDELEAKMAQFRDDNWTKEDSETNTDEFGSGGGEEE